MARTPETINATRNRREACRAAVSGFGLFLAACSGRVEQPTLTRSAENPTAIPTATEIVPTFAPNPTATPPAVATRTPTATASPRIEVDSLFVINPEQIVGSVNRRIIGTGLDKRLIWAGESSFVDRIKKARIGAVRFGGLQNAQYAHEYSDIDSIAEHTRWLGQTIREGGAEPLGIIVGYPEGFNKGDWVSYAERYVALLVEKSKGITKHWELWNEREHEEDGKLSWDEYVSMAQAVIPVIRRVNPAAVIYGPAAPHKDHQDIAASRNLGFDVITYHNYAAPVKDLSELFPYADANYLVDLRAKIAEYGNVGITEYDAAPTYNFGPFDRPDDSEVEQAAGMYHAVAMLNAWNAGAYCLNQYAFDEQGKGIHALVHDGRERSRFNAWRVLGNNVATQIIDINGDQATSAVNGGVRSLATLSEIGRSVYVILANTNSNSGFRVGIDLPDVHIGLVGLSEFKMNTSPDQRELAVNGRRVVYELGPFSMAGFELSLAS